MEYMNGIITSRSPTFAKVTTKANAPMSIIHNSQERMPTILTKELAEEWINDGLNQERITEIATYQYLGELMSAHTIPRDFQNIADPKTKHKYPEFDLELC